MHVVCILLVVGWSLFQVFEPFRIIAVSGVFMYTKTGSMRPIQAVFFPFFGSFAHTHTSMHTLLCLFKLKYEKLKLQIDRCQVDFV